jgi:hypothetical protein
MTAILEMEKTGTQQKIEDKLNAFDNAISKHVFLEIDGEGSLEDISDGHNINYTSDEHFLKIINHKTEQAYSVTIDTIIKQKIDSIIKSLEDGVTIRLFGITRIVGYYSRVNNWNKSKRAELVDRHKGSYKLSECQGLDD